MTVGRRQFESEQALADTVLARLSEAGNILLSSEAPILGRSVDLAYFRQDQLHTVEFKLRDWRQAIRQAVDHQLAADFAFICMPSRRVTTAMREAFEKCGVGLLFFIDATWPFETIIEPSRSRDQWSVAYDLLRQHIQDGNAER